MSNFWIKVNASGINDVAAAPDGRVWVAGTNQTIWYSDDQGKNFIQIIQASGFSRVAVGPDYLLWAVGANGTLWSCNKNFVWNNHSSISNVADVTISPINGNIWITDKDGFILFSNNNGQSFSKIKATGFSRVSADTDGSLWAVGGNGTLWHYQPGGTGDGWTKTAASGMQDVGVELLNYFSGIHAGRLWLAGQNGTVWLSIDKGVTFTQKTDASGFASIAGAGVTSKSLQFSENVEDAWAVGANGTLWYRTILADYIPAAGTTHFKIQYDSALGYSGKRVSEELTWITEGIYQKLSSIFGGTQASVLPISLSIDAMGGGGISSIGAIDIHEMGDITVARWVFVAELAEIFMRSQKNSGWNPNDSKGEGLSLLLASEAFPGIDAPRVNAWLSSGRTEWITKNDNTDSNEVSYGCALLYLNYLLYQLGYSLSSIICDQSPTLSGIYRNLTKKADSLTEFLKLINTNFPAGKIYTNVPNNPFPLSA